jgi:streptogramin lyase
MRPAVYALATLLSLVPTLANSQESKYYDVPKGDFPHDVAVSPSGEVWYAGQKLGIAGRLDPTSGVRQVSWREDRRCKSFTA